MIKVGIVGLGKIGERHLNAYSNIKNVKVEWLCDADVGRIEKYASSYKTTKDFNEVLESDVDVIDVCVPTYLHHEIILKALENDKNVFCEKPLTHKLEYAYKIKKKAEKTDKILMVGYLYRFHPSFELLRDVLNKNIIGKPYYAIFRLGGRGSHRAWKHMTEKGGGAMLDMLTHMLDLAIAYLGEPEEVELLYSDTVLKERLIEGKKVRASAEDCVFLRMETNGGVQVFFSSDLITPSYMNLVEVHGDNGSFIGSILSRFPTIVYCKEPRDIYDRGENVFNFPPVNLIEKELRYFIDCVLNSRKDTSYIDTSIKIMEIIEGVKK